VKKSFFKFVTCYGLAYHFFFFIGVFSLLSFLYALIGKYVISSSFHGTMGVVAALMVGDVDKLGFHGLYQTGFFAFTSVLVLVWQSVLILKFLNRPDYLILSDVITYYPMAYHNKSKDRADFMVFRLMNDGYSDLYDVEVKVTYRLYDEPSKTFQHYACEVKNETIPVLSPQMPFRIYVNTGRMKNIRDLYLDPAGIHQEKAIKADLDSITLENQQMDQFVVFVSGYDSQLDQTKSASWYYKFKNLKYGEFESIEPVDGVFPESELKEKFNQVVNGGEWNQVH